MIITQTRTAHAVQINRYGPPEVLTYSEVLLVPLSGHEVRIKTLVAPVNHTDLEIRAGNWPVTKPDPFPYVPDVEALGVIEEVGESVRGWARGQNVITMMQGLGGVRGERPGSYAEFVTVDAEAVAEIPADVDPVQMAAFHQGDPPSRLSDHATIRGGPRAPAHRGGPCEGTPASDALPTKSRTGEPVFPMTATGQSLRFDHVRPVSGPTLIAPELARRSRRPGSNSRSISRRPALLA